MYRKDYMRLLKPYLSICQAFKCVPFDFDRKSGIVVKTGNASQIWSFRLQCILSVVYTVALVLQICVGRLSLTDSFMGAVFVLVHIIQTSTRWNYSLDKSQGQLINSLVRFEDQVLQGTSQLLNSALCPKLKLVIASRMSYTVFVPESNFHAQICLRLVNRLGCD